MRSKKRRNTKRRTYKRRNTKRRTYKRRNTKRRTYKRNIHGGFFKKTRKKITRFLCDKYCQENPNQRKCRYLGCGDFYNPESVSAAEDVEVTAQAHAEAEAEAAARQAAAEAVRQEQEEAEAAAAEAAARQAAAAAEAAAQTKAHAKATAQEEQVKAQMKAAKAAEKAMGKENKEIMIDRIKEDIGNVVTTGVDKGRMIEEMVTTGVSKSKAAMGKRMRGLKGRLSKRNYGSF